MSKTNQVIAKQNASKLRQWIDSDPEIPMYNGRINKTAICRELEISKSTIGTNEALRALFDELETHISGFKKKSAGNVQDGAAVRELEKTISRLRDDVAALRAENECLKRNLRAEDFLAKTGRLIRL